jgi:hypothetical protein
MNDFGPIDDKRDVLLVVDIQNDFCSGGALAVPRGEEVVPVINQLAQRFAHVVLTQDWHRPSHLSFQPRRRHPVSFPARVRAWRPGARYGTRRAFAAFHRLIEITCRAAILFMIVHPGLRVQNSLWDAMRIMKPACMAAVIAPDGAAHRQPGVSSALSAYKRDDEPPRRFILSKAEA